MFLPLLAIQLTYWTSLTPSIDDSMKAESREIPFTRKCNVMRVKNSALFEIAVVLVRVDQVASFIINANHCKFETGRATKGTYSFSTSRRD